ncbi:MAG: TIGR04222 domain-containing membrane protein [Alkalinema sp. RL_2_19]|nr:TIGR04222 domain-containing membrane protein [Alkalinema sp. RL_2_19]
MNLLPVGAAGKPAQHQEAEVRAIADAAARATAATQLSLFGGSAAEEDPAYLTDQLITYIGNKRSLLPFLAGAIEQVSRRLGARRLACADLFSGSGVVARYLKRHSHRLLVNDLEAYSRITNQCYLANRSELNLRAIGTICLCLGLSSLMASCQAADGNSLNPLTMRGPDFLGFYLFLNMILVGAGLVLRQVLRPAMPANASLTPNLDAYAAAYLAGGKDRLIQAVITRLADQKHLEIGSDQKLNLVTPLPSDASRLESDVVQAISDSHQFNSVKSHANLASDARQFHDRLVQQGLVMTAAQSHKMRLYPALLILLSLGLGVMKILVGLSLGRPVGFFCGDLSRLVGRRWLLLLCSTASD